MDLGVILEVIFGFGGNFGGIWGALEVILRVIFGYGGKSRSTRRERLLSILETSAYCRIMFLEGGHLQQDRVRYPILELLHR